MNILNNLIKIILSSLCWLLCLKDSHDMSSYLAHVEIQLLGWNAQHRGHEATGDIDGHNLLVGALGTDDGLADQPLLHDLRRQEYADSKPTAALWIPWMGQRKPLSPWASPQIPTAPCRWSILERAPHETGSGWTRPSLWGRRVPPGSPSCILGLAAGLCVQTDLPPWSAEIHRSASTAVEFAGPDWSAWSGTGMTRGLKDMEGAKRRQIHIIGVSQLVGQGAALIGSIPSLPSTPFSI